MKVSVLDDLMNTVPKLPALAKMSGHAVEIWNDHTADEDVLAQRLHDTEALVLIRERTPVRTGLLRRLPKLRLISCRGDTPHIDLATCDELGVLVSADQHPDVPSYATAELTWGLIIATLRRIPQQMASLRAGQWQTEMGIGLHGQTLGIFGYGKIGHLLAGYGRTFGMKVVVWGSERARKQAVEDGYDAAQSQAEFFETCDVITLQLRLRDGNRGIVTAAELARMKPTAMIVNTGRAALIAPGALVEALSKGRPGFAAVDVFESEPMRDTEHPLLKLDNVICTPHLGYVEINAFNRSFDTMFEQILAFDAGAPINVINPQVLTRMRKR
ncbi:MAG: D-2-hydroxyacid dehydrogenase family protein [Betaproteobacteria bacterium]|nr:MAG: D-2-hydroxyacid dehydrogenase family protein [Betaproteobacteria bacterium]